MIRGHLPVARAAGFVLLGGGLTALGWAAETVHGGDPVTARHTRVAQRGLALQLAREEHALTPAPAAASVAPPSLRWSPGPLLHAAPVTAPTRRAEAVRLGAAFGKITIPKIHLSMVVVQGINVPQLKLGPGHYQRTGIPGEGRTVGIAGHRTTYLAPFRHIDALRPGDRITVTTPDGRFRYAVQNTRIVKPTDSAVLRDVGYERLVLTACHPLFSAAQRIVVTARRVDPGRLLPPATPGTHGGLDGDPRFFPRLTQTSGRLALASI